jgi:hypothetical protein
MKSMHLLFRISLVVATIFLSSVVVHAEEDSTGHYFPGGLSSFIDVLPAPRDPYDWTLVYANYSTYYHGTGLQNIGLHTTATSYTDTSLFLCQFPGPLPIWGKPQYSIALAVPYTWLKVRTTPTGFHALKDTDNGFGDIEMLPFMMAWNLSKLDRKSNPYTLTYQTTLGVYAPTGNFENDNVANIGRNYWTFEPSAAASYLLAPTEATRYYAFEFTSSVGFDFNTKNGATRYRTGDEFHIDGTLAVHRFLSLLSKSDFVGVGISGFFYQQITRDSGAGAIHGGFEAMTTGVGPDLSYVCQFRYPSLKKVLTIGGDAKWLPELGVSNRLSGNIVWLKLTFSWGTPPPQPTSLAAAALSAPSINALNVLPSL